MSCSKPLPPFTYDVLWYLNRDQLERFSIVCRPLKNFIERYFHSKPYRVFDQLYIRGGSYALVHKCVQWHPNRCDYSVQQFLAGERCNIDFAYYSFAEMRPYLGPTVRINWTAIYVAGDNIYNPEHIEEMESIACDGKISIWNAKQDPSRIVAEDFQPILNSPTILKCQKLFMSNALFSFKDYKVLNTVKIIEIYYVETKIDPKYWLEFLEQPEAKPLVILCHLHRESIGNMLERLLKAFSSAVSPNAFKIVFAHLDDELTELRETNSTSGEKLELKEGLPMEWSEEYLNRNHKYTLERSSI
ncbi:hypothetical protein Ddc_18292 [Ditylenchus destructor]|nr:hypothetical protein Ddc_18292 [Ditylenchus destructor]